MNIQQVENQRTAVFRKPVESANPDSRKANGYKKESNSDVFVKNSDSDNSNADIKQIANIASQAPDMREDKIQAAKRNIAAGVYNTPDVQNNISDALIKLLG